MKYKNIKMQDYRTRDNMRQYFNEHMLIWRLSNIIQKILQEENVL